MNRPAELYRRARHTYREGGAVLLFRRGLGLLRYLLFEHRAYYLYSIALERDDIPEHAPEPPLDSVSHKIVSSSKEAELLEEEGFEFSSRVPDARRRLDAGAIATCVFVGHELGNIVWVATSQQAKDSLPDTPFEIDFSGGECLSGDAWTNPKFRRAGLLAFGDIERRQFQVSQGIRVSSWAIERRNIAPQRFVERLDPRIRAEGRYLRILWWRSWKETPVSSDSAT
jgi:hypothetical protein